MPHPKELSQKYGIVAVEVGDDNVGKSIILVTEMARYAVSKGTLHKVMKSGEAYGYVDEAVNELDAKILFAKTMTHARWREIAKSYEFTGTNPNEVDRLFYFEGTAWKIYDSYMEEVTEQNGGLAKRINFNGQEMFHVKNERVIRKLLQLFPDALTITGNAAGIYKKDD